MIDFVKDRAFPDFIQDYAPKVIDFFGNWVSWMNLKDNCLYKIDTLSTEKDIDESINSFSTHTKEFLTKDFPESIIGDLKLVLKNIMFLYKSKSSTESYDMLFKVLFGSGAEITYPKDQVLKLDDGRFEMPYYLCLDTKDEKIYDYEKYANHMIIGLESRTKAFISGVNYYSYEIYKGENYDFFLQMYNRDINITEEQYVKYYGEDLYLGASSDDFSEISYDYSVEKAEITKALDLPDFEEKRKKILANLELIRDGYLSLIEDAFQEMYPEAIEVISKDNVTDEDYTIETYKNIVNYPANLDSYLLEFEVYFLELYVSMANENYKEMVLNSRREKAANYIHEEEIKDTLNYNTFLLYYGFMTPEGEIDEEEDPENKVIIKVSSQPRKAFIIEPVSGSFISSEVSYDLVEETLSVTYDGEYIYFLDTTDGTKTIPNLRVDLVQQKKVDWNIVTSDEGDVYKIPSALNWKNSKGFLDSEMVFQNGYRYQDFSYVINSSISIKTWKRFVESILHPAGLKYFGELVSPSDDGEYPPKFYIDQTLSKEPVFDRGYDANGNGVEFIRNSGDDFFIVDSLDTRESPMEILKKDTYTTIKKYKSIDFKSFSDVNRYFYEGSYYANFNGELGIFCEVSGSLKQLYIYFKNSELKYEWSDITGTPEKIEDIECFCDVYSDDENKLLMVDRNKQLDGTYLDYTLTIDYSSSQVYLEKKSYDPDLEFQVSSYELEYYDVLVGKDEDDNDVYNTFNIYSTTSQVETSKKYYYYLTSEKYERVSSGSLKSISYNKIQVKSFLINDYIVKVIITSGTTKTELTDNIEILKYLTSSQLSTTEKTKELATYPSDEYRKLTTAQRDYTLEPDTLNGIYDSRNCFYGFLETFKILNDVLNHIYNIHILSKFVDGKTYNIGDIVYFNGSYYKCTKETTKSPLSEPTSWTLERDENEFKIETKIKDILKAQNHSETPDYWLHYGREIAKGYGEDENSDVIKPISDSFNKSSVLLFRDDGSLIKPEIIDWIRFRCSSDISSDIMRGFTIHSGSHVLENTLDGSEWYPKVDSDYLTENFMLFTTNKNSDEYHFIKNMNLEAFYLNYQEYLNSLEYFLVNDKMYYVSNDYTDYAEVFNDELEEILENAEENDFLEIVGKTYLAEDILPDAYIDYAGNYNKLINNQSAVKTYDSYSIKQYVSKDSNGRYYCLIRTTLSEKKEYYFIINGVRKVLVLVNNVYYYVDGSNQYEVTFFVRDNLTYGSYYDKYGDYKEERLYLDVTYSFKDNEGTLITLEHIDGSYYKFTESVDGTLVTKTVIVEEMDDGKHCFLETLFFSPYFWTSYKENVYFTTEVLKEIINDYVFFESTDSDVLQRISFTDSTIIMNGSIFEYAEKVTYKELYDISVDYDYVLQGKTTSYYYFIKGSSLVLLLMKSKVSDYITEKNVYATVNSTETNDVTINFKDVQKEFRTIEIDSKEYAIYYNIYFESKDITKLANSIYVFKKDTSESIPVESFILSQIDGTKNIYYADLKYDTNPYSYNLAGDKVYFNLNVSTESTQNCYHYYIKNDTQTVKLFKDDTGRFKTSEDFILSLEYRESSYALIRDFKMYKENGYIIDENGNKLEIYTDKTGEYVVSKDITYYLNKEYNPQYYIQDKKLRRYYLEESKIYVEKTIYDEYYVFDDSTESGMLVVQVASGKVTYKGSTYDLLEDDNENLYFYVRSLDVSGASLIEKDSKKYFVTYDGTELLVSSALKIEVTEITNNKRYFVVFDGMKSYLKTSGDFKFLDDYNDALSFYYDSVLSQFYLIDDIFNRYYFPKDDLGDTYFYDKDGVKEYFYKTKNTYILFHDKPIKITTKLDLTNSHGLKRWMELNKESAIQTKSFLKKKYDTNSFLKIAEDELENSTKRTGCPIYAVFTDMPSTLSNYKDWKIEGADSGVTGYIKKATTYVFSDSETPEPCLQLVLDDGILLKGEKCLLTGKTTKEVYVLKKIEQNEYDSSVKTIQTYNLTQKSFSNETGLMFGYNEKDFSHRFTVIRNNTILETYDTYYLQDIDFLKHGTQISTSSLKKEEFSKEYYGYTQTSSGLVRVTLVLEDSLFSFEVSGLVRYSYKGSSYVEDEDGAYIFFNDSYVIFDSILENVCYVTYNNLKDLVYYIDNLYLKVQTKEDYDYPQIDSDFTFGCSDIQRYSLTSDEYIVNPYGNYLLINSKYVPARLYGSTYYVYYDDGRNIITSNKCTLQTKTGAKEKSVIYYANTMRYEIVNSYDAQVYSKNLYPYKKDDAGLYGYINDRYTPIQVLGNNFFKVSKDNIFEYYKENESTEYKVGIRKKNNSYQIISYYTTNVSSQGVYKLILEEKADTNEILLFVDGLFSRNFDYRDDGTLEINTFSLKHSASGNLNLSYELPVKTLMGCTLQDILSTNETDYMYLLDFTFGDDIVTNVSKTSFEKTVLKDTLFSDNVYHIIDTESNSYSVIEMYFVSKKNEHTVERSPVTSKNILNIPSDGISIYEKLKDGTYILNENGNFIKIGDEYTTFVKEYDTTYSLNTENLKNLKYYLSNGTEDKNGTFLKTIGEVYQEKKLPYTLKTKTISGQQYNIYEITYDTEIIRYSFRGYEKSANGDYAYDAYGHWIPIFKESSLGDYFFMNCDDSYSWSNYQYWKIISDSSNKIQVSKLTSMDKTKKYDSTYISTNIKVIGDVYVPFINNIENYFIYNRASLMKYPIHYFAFKKNKYTANSLLFDDTGHLINPLAVNWDNREIIIPQDTSSLGLYRIYGYSGMYGASFNNAKLEFTKVSGKYISEDGSSYVLNDTKRVYSLSKENNTQNKEMVFINGNKILDSKVSKTVLEEGNHPVYEISDGTYRIQNKVTTAELGYMKLLSVAQGDFPISYIYSNFTKELMKNAVSGNVYEYQDSNIQSTALNKLQSENIVFQYNDNINDFVVAYYEESFLGSYVYGENTGKKSLKVTLSDEYKDKQVLLFVNGLSSRNFVLSGKTLTISSEENIDSYEVYVFVTSSSFDTLSYDKTKYKF